MKTQILKLDNSESDLEVIREAAQLVEDGELVVFPTETVYGIAAKASFEAIAKLDEIKKRDAIKHYTLHISSPSEVEKYVPALNANVKRLIQNALPGPLTLVFDVSNNASELQEKFTSDIANIIYKGDSIGVRCPDNPVASTLLSLTPSPVLAPSANLGGMPPATDAQMAFDMLDGKVAMILDDGQCREKQSSTVVALDNLGFKILREGKYSSNEIKQMSELNIVFVCTGNTCRSPMAQALFSKALADNLGSEVDQLVDLGYIVSSAGVMAAIDQPASQEAVNVCRELKLDISQHRSKGLSEKLILESDVIFVMSQSHKDRIVSFYPEVASKCNLLLNNADIPDPYGGDEDLYRKCALKINEAVHIRLGEILL